MKHFHFILFLLIIAAIAKSCSPKEKLQTVDAPNILWIVLEDTAPLMSCYGATLIQTPTIDKLAESGVMFTKAFMPSPVCSPSRSSIITGVMSTTLGTHNHHSSRTDESAIFLPNHVKTLPEIFKKAGYFTFNNGKDDYNFSYDRKDLYSQDYRVHPLYGKSGLPIELSTLSEKQPFFGQIQLRGGKEIYNSKFKENVVHPVDRASIQLPPYIPSHPELIEEYANHLDAIQITDNRIKGIINKLEENRVLDNTIVVFFSDHGMRMTRNKQFLYEGGLHVPLIIADFTNTKGLHEGATYDGLVSGLDLAATSLWLADIACPDYMEGRNVFDTSSADRTYVIATRDRCDFTIDRIRAVRTKRYKYIRNFLEDRPATQPTYMDVDEVPFVKTMHELYNSDQLNSAQRAFFTKIRPREELYDLINDPFEINNLVGLDEFEKVRKEHETILNNWIRDTDDQGQYPENEEGLKLMLGIWGKYAVNPEYDALKEKYPQLAGSQFNLKGSTWKDIKL